MQRLRAVAERCAHDEDGLPGTVPGSRTGTASEQELYPGQAEDRFQVLDLTSRVSVPYGSFEGAPRTKEWTPLEPGVVDDKYYVGGIGTVREVTVEGRPFEENVLTPIRNGSG
ncbi:hypothetical protein [Streptomyces sp. NPDC048419]|uniref:hypothetical protein n=1 Tax=Streptomyces sp. NPDC048419 TaxID=3365547 RepID=UPI0037154A75